MIQFISRRILSLWRGLWASVFSVAVLGEEKREVTVVYMTFSGTELLRVPPCSEAWIRDSKNNTFWLKGPCSAEVSLNEHGGQSSWRMCPDYLAFLDGVLEGAPSGNS